MNTRDRKTKILFVITKSNFGGAQKYVYDLARSLPQDDFDVAVVTGGSGNLIQKLNDEHIRVILTSSLIRDIDTKNDLASFFELTKIFRNERPDVVHLNSAKAGGVGALAARLAGVPNIIFTAHGWAFNEERPCWQRSIIRFFSWLTVIFSHKTIAVSEAVNHDATNWPFIKGKVVTIHNGIDAPAFLTKEESRKALFDTIKIPSDALIIGTNAELHKNKGLPYAIKAMKQLGIIHKNIYYVITSDGEEKGSLQNLIDSLGLQKHVFLLGFIPEVARFLPAFDIFLLPSIKEGLPYAILEAGYAKLPVVATRIGGIPEIIEDEKTGSLISPRSAPAIANKVDLLLKNRDAAKKLGEALHDLVSVKFSLKRMISETITLYTKKQG